MFVFDKVSVTGEVEFINLFNLDMTAEMNEHAVLELYGLIPSIDDHEFHRLIGTKISVSFGTVEDCTPVFAGVIQKAALSVLDREHYARIQCRSVSVEFDTIRRKRSYQDEHMTYRELFSQVSGKGRTIQFVRPADRGTGEPLIQYEETDWEFCKRIASRFLTAVMPDLTSFYPQIAVGVVEGKQYFLEDSHPYHLCQDFDGCRRMAPFHKCGPGDFWVYTISEERNFMLGDKVWFRDRKWTVLWKHFYLKDGRPVIEYKLGTEWSLGIRPVFNTKIRGLSLEGTVKWVCEEKIKVHLDIDEEEKRSQEQLYAFPYVPITGNLMYAMPEAGTKVCLYFPSEREGEGMVTESRQEPVEYPDESQKLLETKEGKQLGLKPGQIVCKNGTGRIKMELSDSIGAALLSGQKIQISARDSVRFQTDGAVVHQALLGYHFESRQSGDCLDITGNQILMTTEKAIAGALPHELGHKPIKTGVTAEAGDPFQYISGVLGGIPQGAAPSEMAAAVLGAIVVCTSPSREYQMSDLIFLGRNQRK